jgi:hypothetical protein
MIERRFRAELREEEGMLLGFVSRDGVTYGVLLDDAGLLFDAPIETLKSFAPGDTSNLF